MEVKLDRSTARGTAWKSSTRGKNAGNLDSKDAEMVQSELLKREKELKQNEKKYKDYTLHLRETITNNEVYIKSMKDIQRQKDEEIAQLELLNMSLKSERDILVCTNKHSNVEAGIIGDRQSSETARIRRHNTTI